PAAKEAFEKAVLLLEDLVAGPSATLDDRIDLIYGRHRLGMVLDKLGDRNGAEKEFRQALTLLPRLEGELQENKRVRHLWFQCLSDLGLLLPRSTDPLAVAPPSR